jgi:hypothetical protein
VRRVGIGRDVDVMQAYDGKQWVRLPAEPWLRPGTVTVRVTGSVAVAPVEDQFFVRERNVRWLLGYLRRIGVRETVRKVRSRHSERLRNDRWLVVGTGAVVSSRTTEVAVGSKVGFVSASTPRAVDTVVVSAEQVVDPAAVADLVREGDGWSVAKGEADSETRALIELVLALEASCEAARPVDAALETPLGRLAARTRRHNHLSLPPISGNADELPVQRASSDGRPTASLFGLGQYAKTQILPNLGDHLDIRWIHEVDPFQLIGARSLLPAAALDCAPVLGSDEQPTALVAAGFHHTHADCLQMAVDRVIPYVILEKPPVTDDAGIDALRQAFAAGVTVLAAYQRPHSTLHAEIVAAFPRGEPVSYFATVHEVPLPQFHWYRWPCSGTEVLSNACHWIDHFLALNPGVGVERTECRSLRHGSVTYVRLASGAELNLVVTHEGSSRLGVRDACMITCGPMSARWCDATLLIEDSTRVVARRREHPYEAHRRMYQAFGTQIAAGSTSPHDAHGILRSAELILRLDEQLRHDRAADH